MIILLFNCNPDAVPHSLLSLSTVIDGYSTIVVYLKSDMERYG